MGKPTDAKVDSMDDTFAFVGLMGCQILMASNVF